jgi:hypothetical protein
MKILICLVTRMTNRGSPATDELVLKVWREREALSARLPEVKALAWRNFGLLPPLLARTAA